MRSDGPHVHVCFLLVVGTVTFFLSVVLWLRDLSYQLPWPVSFLGRLAKHLQLQFKVFKWFICLMFLESDNEVGLLFHFEAEFYVGWVEVGLRDGGSDVGNHKQAVARQVLDNDASE